TKRYRVRPGPDQPRSTRRTLPRLVAAKRTLAVVGRMTGGSRRCRPWPGLRARGDSLYPGDERIERLDARKAREHHELRISLGMRCPFERLGRSCRTTRCSTWDGLAVLRRRIVNGSVFGAAIASHG